MSSMNASLAGLQVIRLILSMPVQIAGAELGRVQPFLTYPEDEKVFDFVRGHFAAHGKMPHPDTITDALSIFLPQALETYEFHVAALRNRFIEDAMRTASETASALLMEGKAADALSSMLGALLPVTQGHGGYAISDLRHTTVLDFYKTQLDGTAPPVKKIGYPTLDKQGGIEDGDMIGIVGRPASGKTWLMLDTAINYWSTYGEPVMFVTQEMSAKQIEKRALPMIAEVHPSPLYQGAKHQYVAGGISEEDYLAKLYEAKAMITNAAPFLIYDSKMAGTVRDIESIASMHGVKRIWIDGAYMIRHPDPRLGRYARVPENLDLIKYWCQRSGVSVISSWQFKRGAGKNDDANATPDLDDIGYSHAISEYMGVILGLLDNPKSVSQMNKKHVTIMKGRNGEVGGFNIHWNFATMDFSEITAQETDTDLTYL